jgi:hypothetical protein
VRILLSKSSAHVAHVQQTRLNLLHRGERSLRSYIHAGNGVVLDSATPEPEMPKFAPITAAAAAPRKRRRPQLNSRGILLLFIFGLQVWAPYC